MSSSWTSFIYPLSSRHCVWYNSFAFPMLPRKRNPGAPATPTLAAGRRPPDLFIDLNTSYGTTAQTVKTEFPLSESSPLIHCPPSPPFSFTPPPPFDEPPLFLPLESPLSESPQSETSPQYILAAPPMPPPQSSLPRSSAPLGSNPAVSSEGEKVGDQPKLLVLASGPRLLIVIPRKNRKGPAPITINPYLSPPRPGQVHPLPLTPAHQPGNV